MDGVTINSRPSLSIGIEEEYQTVDPVTRDLKSHIHAEIVEKGRLLMAERVKPEMHQSVVEIGTRVCTTIQEARDEIRARHHLQILDDHVVAIVGIDFLFAPERERVRAAG